MNTKAIQLTLAGVLALASLSGAWAADDKKASLKDTRGRIDLRQEVASPAGGEFAAAGETMRAGAQQDVGGLAGNASGIVGMPTATGAPSTFPNPGVPSGY